MCNSARLKGKKMENVTLKQVVSAVRELAAARPDTIYNRTGMGRCEYAAGECSDGSVGCLFGQALKSLGIEPWKLRDQGGNRISFALGDLGIIPVADKFEDPDVRWCARVQRSQDGGSNWKMAIVYADIGG